MPAYFYHLRLEVIPTSNTLALESARESLFPFQKRARPSSGAGRDSLGKSKASRELTLQQKLRHSPTSSNDSTPLRHNPTPDASSDTSSIASLKPPPNLETDLRSGAILIECIDMVSPDESSRTQGSTRGSALATTEDNLVTAGIGTDILGGLRTKGRYIPLDQKVGDSVWGIVHLYRDSHETPYLTSNEDDYPTYLKGSAAAAPRHPSEQQAQQALPQSSVGASTDHSRGRGSVDLAAYPFPVTASSSAQSVEDDCTTLCILAVPSYLSPSDFLGFVGEKTMDDVSHFRMIRTPRANRYMVLMKFRGGRKAMEWQKEWNGKVFNSMEVSARPI